MKTSILFIVVLLFPASLVAQYRGGISMTAGIAENSPITTSLSYLEPVLINQLYVEGGYRYFENRGSIADGILWSPFTPIHQVHLGLFIGDYLYANPRITYNWYGTESSIGWAIAAGMLVHPANFLGLGISVGYDRFNNELPLDPSGTKKRISFSVVANLHPFR